MVAAPVPRVFTRDASRSYGDRRAGNVLVHGENLDAMRRLTRAGFARRFRCDYLDRSGSDLRADDGSAGSMNQRPLTADELQKLAEYLWQFTMYNNSDYAVESSKTAVNGGQLVETIRMGQLVRGVSGACDTVQVSDWTHTMSSTDGSLTRTLTAVRSFQVKSTSAGVEACAG